MRMLELFFIFMLIYGLTCLAEDALSPPLSMASKEFYRAVRSEARTHSLNDAERFMDDIIRLSLRDIEAIWQIEDMMDKLERVWKDMKRIEARDISEDTKKRLDRVHLKVTMMMDRLGARLEELLRSESRMKGSA